MRVRRLLIGSVFALVALSACGGGAATSAETSSAEDVATTQAPRVAPSTTTEPAPKATTTTEAPTTSTTAATPNAVLAGLNMVQPTSGRMAGSVTVSGLAAPGIDAGTMEIPFSGAFAANGDFELVIDLSGIAAAAGDLPPEMSGLFDEMAIRQIGDTAYIRMPMLSAMFGLPDGWLEGTPEEGDAMASEMGPVTPPKPDELLDALADAGGTIEDLGGEHVNGVEATRYRVVLDAEELYDRADAETRRRLQSQDIPAVDIPLDLWITDEGVVTRLVMDVDGTALPATSPEESFDSLRMVYDLTEIGDDIEIEAPPADEVIAMDELGGLFGGFADTTNG